MLYSFLIVVQLISVVLCHGYIKFVGVDNKVYVNPLHSDIPYLIFLTDSQMALMDHY